MSDRGEEAIRAAVAGAVPLEEAEGDDGRTARAGAAGGGGRDLQLARKLLNDSGNGERLRARYGRNLLYVPEGGRYAWSGSRWSVVAGERDWALAAQKTALAMLAREAPALEAALVEAGESGVAKRLHQFREHAINSGNQAKLNAMQAVSEPHLQKRIDELDADPFLFNVQNGTLELGSKRDPQALRLRRHARLDYITHSAPIGYDPDAQCPLFRAFLDQILPDTEVQHWVQRWCGYCLSADYGEHKLAIFWGEGRNGKGTLTKIVQYVLGDYAAIVQFQSFVDAGQRRGDASSPDLAKLTGARAVYASEGKTGARLDDGLIKQLTGGDTAAVRRLYKDFFDLVPTFKITLIANNRPVVKDDSHGMWSRVMLVPFQVTIPDRNIDKSLFDKLKLEGPGILNWCLDGFRLWREQGLSAPQAILAATADYRKESDLIGQFLEAACVRDPGGRIASSQLYACYQGWCEANELRPVKQTAFGRELTRRQILASKDGTVYRVGIRWSGDIDWDWQVPY